MSYSLFEKMGFQNLDISYLLVGMMAVLFILLVLVIVQTIRFSSILKKYKKFMSGKNAKSLEDNIEELFEDNQFIKSETDRNKRNIELLFHKVEGTFQKVGIVKYDAFAQMGGQLSFSLALLDENDNGFILNSVHSSEGCYSYTKEIENGICAISLGDEEKKALDMAMGIIVD